MKYHYVYRITNIKTKMHYYGVRSSKIIPIDDLGIIYFSSSKNKDFLQDQKDNLPNYRYKVIRIYNTRKDAINMEIKLHNKFNVGMNESFYNLSKQTSTGYDTEGTNRSKESRRKQSDSIKGKKRSREWAQKISESLKNHPAFKTEDFREKCRNNNLGDKNPNYGRPHPESQRNKISETLKNNPKIICPHCGKEGAKSPMLRWHFENCKEKLN